MKDRVAIVTGGGLGLGRLYALALSQRGAKVVVNDYGGSLDGKPGDANRAQCVVDEIKAAGGIAVADHHDVSDKVGAKAIVETAVKAFGSVHILINNAGITGKVSPHDDVDGAAFMRVIEISALGTTLVTSAAYGIMAKQKFGRIINISSNAIYGFGAGGDCAYGASKGATFAITRELGRWSERDGIKINAILPSAASRMTELSEGTKKLAETYFPAKVCPSSLDELDMLWKYSHHIGSRSIRPRPLLGRMPRLWRGLHFQRQQSREGGHRHVSWSHVGNSRRVFEAIRQGHGEKRRALPGDEHPGPRSVCSPSSLWSRHGRYPRLWYCKSKLRRRHCR